MVISRKRNLFAYGTLRCDDILKMVVGHYESAEDAVLRDYRCLKIKDEVYPGLVAWPDCVTKGVVYFGISEGGWAKLDDFEGNMYVRVPVMATGENDQTHISETYVVKEKFQSCMEERDWDFEEFIIRHKQTFLSEYRGFHI